MSPSWPLPPAEQPLEAVVIDLYPLALDERQALGALKEVEYLLARELLAVDGEGGGGREQGLGADADAGAEVADALRHADARRASSPPGGHAAEDTGTLDGRDVPQELVGFVGGEPQRVEELARLHEARDKVACVGGMSQLAQQG